jgi:small-conductance mechanosensitive channel/CRP-like cAMP-binding protein
MSHEIIVHGILALALGFSVGLILLLIRKHAPGSRLRVWVLLAGLAGATYLVMQFFSVPGGSTPSRIALSATIILGTNMVLQLLNLLLWDYLLRRRGDIHIPRLVIDIINFIVLAIVAMVVLNRVFGMQLTAFLVTSTVLSAVIGLSLQDILGNLFAGLALQMERPYSLGEWVSLGDKEGIVVQMNWRTLTIRTRPGDYVTIPNATISKEIVTNYSRPDLKHRCSVSVGLAYDHVPGEVKMVLTGAMAEVGGILDDPAPEVLLQQFDAYTVNYDARFWISEFARRQQIEDAVRSRIWYCLQRAGLTIPYPIRNITMRTVSEDQEAKANENRRLVVISELRKVDLFRSLDADQIADLADSSAKLLYARGETLVRQGGSGDSLFLITDGEVDVSVSTLPGESTHLATLGKGTYFGEMSLLTGEPRSATITANTETEVIVVEKAGLSRLLETEAAILEPLSAMLEKRLEDLSSRVRDHEESIASAKKPEHKENLLSRIRDFFGLG